MSEKLIKDENLQQLLELSGGTNDLLKELLEKYLVNSEQYMKQANQALAEKNYDQVKFAVHTMKGSSLSLGLIVLGDLMSDLNNRAKAGNYDGFEAELAKVPALLEEVRQYWQSLQ